MTEKEFSQQIVDLATLYGWRVCRFPTWRPTGASPGWPDLVLVKGKFFIVRELKVGKGEPTPSQWAWLLALRGAGVDAGVWRPEDWPRIQELLTA